MWKKGNHDIVIIEFFLGPYTSSGPDDEFLFLFGKFRRNRIVIIGSSHIKIASLFAGIIRGFGLLVAKIKIPAGIESGSYFKLENEGNEGSPGYKGDLYVVVHIKEHKFFKRQDDDVIINLPITLSQAVLGAEIEIPTIYGMEKIKIPPGIQNGEVITLRGKGFQRRHSASKGAMHIVVNVEIPKNINQKLKEIFLKLNQIETENDYEEVKNFNKIKENLKKGENNNG